MNLHDACRNGMIQEVKRLLDEGANISELRVSWLRETCLPMEILRIYEVLSGLVPLDNNFCREIQSFLPGFRPTHSLTPA